MDLGGESKLGRAIRLDIVNFLLMTPKIESLPIFGLPAQKSLLELAGLPSR